MSGCSNYAYARRGYACAPVTSALTSNRKFLPPNDPVYYQPKTYMMQYPGYSGDFITAVGDYQYPEQIKSYFGKNFGPDYAPDRHSHVKEADQVPGGCKGCGGLRGST